MEIKQLSFIRPESMATLFLTKLIEFHALEVVELYSHNKYEQLLCIYDIINSVSIKQRQLILTSMMEKSMLLLILLCFFAHSIHIRYDSDYMEHLQVRHTAISINNLKVFNWNMGSGYCPQDSGQSYPNCDDYIVRATEKLIEVAGNGTYDILCLQQFPKYHRQKQRIPSEKMAEFALKHKYSIFRQQKSTHLENAILSKIPMQEMKYLDLSSRYGAQKMSLNLNGFTIQVGNIHAATQQGLPDFEARKKDISKYITWLSQNKRNITIIAGDFNMNFNTVQQIIKELNLFGNKVMNKVCAKSNIDCIFVFGEAKQALTNKIQMLNLDHLQGIEYTYNFSQNFSYIPNRAVTIYTDFTRSGGRALLGVNGMVYNNDYQWAFFSDTNYMTSNKNYRYKFIIETFKDDFRISCPYDAVSYLALNNKITTQNSYQWAFWGQLSYLQGSNRYPKDPRFKYNSGIYIYYEEQSFLATNNKIAAYDYEWAQFATSLYIHNNQRRYSSRMFIQDLKQNN